MSEYQVLGCKFSHRILIFMDEVLYLLLRGPNAFLTSDALYLVFFPLDCCKVSFLFWNFLVSSPSSWWSLSLKRHFQFWQNLLVYFLNKVFSWQNIPFFFCYVFLEFLLLRIWASWTDPWYFSPFPYLSLFFQALCSKRLLWFYFLFFLLWFYFLLPFFKNLRVLFSFSFFI